MSFYLDFFYFSRAELLVMAHIRQEYRDFVNLVNPGDGTIRDALWDHFFPDGVNTRDPIVYEFKVRLWFSSPYCMLGPVFMVI